MTTDESRVLCFVRSCCPSSKNQLFARPLAWQHRHLAWAGLGLGCTAMSISTRAADFDSLRRFNDFLGELSCVICLEPLANPVTLACSHTFCRECILRALSVAPVCPLCKAVTARRGLKDDAFVAQLVQAAVQQREILRAQVEAHRAQPPAGLRFSQQETQAPSSPAQSRRVQPRRVKAADLQASSPHLPALSIALPCKRPLLMRARASLGTGGDPAHPLHQGDRGAH